MSTIESLDAVLEDSLRSLAAELVRKDWSGRREREVVSLFCFGHLIRHSQPSGVLRDATQVAIEVAVPQVSAQHPPNERVRNKTQVCKDIVIWPDPRMTCWDSAGKPTIRPLSVIEWKHDEDAISEYDLRWLRRFSLQAPEFVGYAVCTQRPARRFTLSCTRVYMGEAQDGWILIP